MTHRIQARVYYEDTDAGGVVYYANYLRFAERGRTELLRDAGHSNTSILENFETGFVVKSLTANYIKPARLDDLLIIETSVKDVKKSSFIMKQSISSANGLLFETDVRIACINKSFKPCAIPAQIKQALAIHMEKTIS